MNYWWMNTDPESWNIFDELAEGEEEPWNARDKNGNFKKYMQAVRPGNLGLCYQTHHAGKLVAEMRVTSGVGGRSGKEVVRFELVRFLEPPVAWFTIEASQIIPPKHIKTIRRNTLFPLSAMQYKELVGLSGASGIRKVVGKDLEALKSEESRKEGGLKSRYVNYYERRPELRAAAINYHHTVCQVCGFDFEKVYGDRGAGFIEVHHLRPIATLKSATKIDPRKDMSVVCANCHRMIHRKRDHVLSLSELRKLLNNA